MHRMMSLVVSLQANCSTHEVEWQKNSYRWKCCVCMVRNTSCHQQNEHYVDHVHQ